MSSAIIEKRFSCLVNTSLHLFTNCSFSKPLHSYGACRRGRTKAMNRNQAESSNTRTKQVLFLCRPDSLAVYSTHTKDPLMKRIVVAGLLSTAIPLAALAALKQNDAAPTFTAQASLAGKTFQYS